MRHYYDLYMLLEAPRVKAFIGTREYEDYKKVKIRALDSKEFEHMNTMLLAPAPKFEDLIARLRENVPGF